MQLIPSLVIQHLHNPAQIETLFIKYIKAAELTIDSSKTIAGIAYYHKRQFVTGEKSVEFFKGTLNPNLTNMPGNDFIRPQTEHSLIWAIRFESVIDATITDNVWLPGVSASGFLNNLEMTIITNSEVKIKDIPLSEALSDLTVRDDGIYPMPEPIFWGGQQAFVVDVVNGEDLGAPDAEQNLKCTLIGLGLI